MSPATAKIVIEGVADFRFGRLWVEVEKRLRLHDHAINAVATLGGLFINEGLLEPVRLAVFRQSGKCGYRPANSRLCLGHTGPHRFAIYEHRARTALRPSTTEFQTVLVKIICQDEQERSFSWRVDRNCDPIEFEI